MLMAPPTWVLPDGSSENEVAPGSGVPIDLSPRVRARPFFATKPASASPANSSGLFTRNVTVPTPFQVGCEFCELLR